MQNAPAGSAAGVDLPALLARLARRGGQRTEADVQADVRTLLLYGGLSLDDDQVDVVNLESPTKDGTRRRLDVEVGSTVIEVKKDLRTGNVREDAIEQLADYVRVRAKQTGDRYVGVLTDGADWHLYSLEPSEELRLVSTLTVNPNSPDPERLTTWLEAVLASASKIKATPRSVQDRLGASSPSFLLDRAELTNLYEAVQDSPEVRLKRELWAKLLTTAFGTNFTNADGLFVEHTYLVVLSEVVAHAVVGFDIASPDLSASTLVSGGAFREAQITGVVENDFFDWVLHAPAGSAFVRRLARRLSRFDWHDVEHDILKILYESVIDAEQRHSLGEYYTPDWLADRVVREVVPSPLATRVLDPSCGSGTFVFHAVRNYLAAADEAGIPSHEALAGVVSRVVGMDVHPVATTLARTTYLLAIGGRRINDPRRGPIAIPIYLGDSLQGDQQKGVLGAGALAIPTSEGGGLFTDELRFPDSTTADAARFDQLVNRLTDLANDREPASKPPSLAPVFQAFAIHPNDQPVIAATFASLCRLVDEGRDHIWGYYVRNLARPLWLARPENRVDALVGNPPWLSYRYMTKRMQERFAEESKARGLWAGSKVATHQDLSAYFVARCSELYLNAGGRVGFVMPLAVLSRLSYQGFRTGNFQDVNETAENFIRWDVPWDLDGIKPSPFPVPCCVVLGDRGDGPRAMPAEVIKWQGRLDDVRTDWDTAKGHLSTSAATTQIATTDGPRSPYAARFIQGANLVPRMLMMVEADKTSPLGTGAGRRAVRSMRTTQEKQPWKGLPGLSGVVESQFVHPVHLGSTIAPFRPLSPWEAVLPVNENGLLSTEGDPAQIDHFTGLAAWWRAAEKVWLASRSPSSKIDLNEQVNWQGKFQRQFPCAPIRVVYSASGTTLAAAVLTDPRACIEHKLYWAAASTMEEARYLVAILNSVTLLREIQGLQSRGQFGARDFDTYVFAAPFPIYDPEDDRHRALSTAAARAEKIAASVQLTEGVQFQAARKQVRQALITDGVARLVDELVAELLGVAPPALEHLTDGLNHE